MRGKGAHAPMRATVARSGLQRCVENALLQFERQHFGRALTSANAGHGLQTLIALFPDHKIGDDLCISPL